MDDTRKVYKFCILCPIFGVKCQGSQLLCTYLLPSSLLEASHVFGDEKRKRRRTVPQEMGLCKSEEPWVKENRDCIPSGSENRVFWNNHSLALT